MPTFFNPGGRTLGGGDIMPLPMPWPQAAPARSAIPSAIVGKPATIEFTNCLVLHTADILSWRAGYPAPARAVNLAKISCPKSFARSGGFSRPRFGGLLLYPRGSLGRGTLCRRCAFRMNRQAALLDQLHGAVDRNPHRTSVLIHPVIGGKLPVLILDERAKLRALVFFEPWFREIFCVLRRDGAGVGLWRHHRAHGRLVRRCITVEEAVHAEHDEIDDDADQHQACQKIKRTPGTQILLLETVVIGHVLMRHRLIRHGVLTHALAPIRPAQSRRKRATAAANSGCGRSTRSRFRPWRRGARGLPG